MKAFNIPFKKVAVLFLICFFNRGLAQTSTENYIYSVDVHAPVTNEAILPFVSSGFKVEAVGYLDGIGRTVQQVVSKSSPGGKDEVSVMDYDYTGRVKTNYLPFTVSGISLPTAAYRTGALALQQNFYTTPQAKFKTNSTPYSEVNYDDSPLDILKEASSPAPAWTLASGKTVKQQYTTNAANTILMWTATSTVAVSGSGSVPLYYNAKDLMVSTTINEEGHAVTSYVDKGGKPVCDAELVNAATSAYNYTYYVYNDFNELVCVISPQGFNIMKQSTNYSTTLIPEYVFLYQYDKRGNAISKKVPNKAVEYFIYNSLNQLVFYQNQNLRSLNKWMFYKYDKQGRPVISGLYTTTNSAIMPLIVESATLFYEDRTSVNFSTQFGYTNNTFPNTNTEIHTVNYYDDYDFDNNGTDDDSPDLTPLTFIQAPGQSAPAGVIPVSYSNQTAGLLTGSRVKVLETGASVPFLTSSVFYDEKGRVVQTKQNNYAGGSDINSVNYTFDGRVLFSESKHVGFSSTQIKQTFRYYYYDNKMGRLQSVISKINSDPVTVINTVNYNETGQLVEKNIHSTNGSTYLQSIDYTYNELGMLTHLNNADLTGPNTTNNNDDVNDLFGYELKYNAPATGITGSTAKYDGSVSEFYWRSISDPAKRGYVCQYDLKDRLTAASHAEYNTSTNQWTATQKYDEYGISYDANGNIASLKRTGYRQGNAFGLMDDLTYNYNGNQLTHVDEAASTQGFNDFKPTGDNDYGYDGDGNMVSDPSKTMDISYNHLDLASAISGSAGTMTFVYDAEGNLLKRAYTGSTTGSSTDYTYYINGIVYDAAGVKYFSQPEGRVVPDLSSTQQYRNEYYYTDYLGNTRLTYSDLDFNNAINSSTEVLQENGFYPYGLDMYGQGKTQIGLTNNDKLNGAEYYPEMGINLHNFGPRNYDPALGRFLNIDPLAENTSSQGAYNFALDNPFNYNDPSGMAAEDWVKNLETGVTTWDPSVQDQKSYNEKYGGNSKFSYEGKWTDHATDENGKLFNGFGGGRKVYLDKPTGDNSEVTSSKASISQGSNSKNEYNRSYQAFVEYGGDGSGSFKDNTMYVLDQVRVFSPLTQLADAISIWSGTTDSRGIPKSNMDGAYQAAAGIPLVAVEEAIALKFARSFRGFQDHHIITNQLYSEYKAEFDAMGWNQNHALNLKKLPAPFHGNHPAYTNFVRKEILNLIEKNQFNLQNMQKVQFQMRQHINKIYLETKFQRMNQYFKHLGY